MSRSREERQRDIEDGLKRLRFHPDRIPIGYEAKTTIREVQRLMKDEATDLMAEGDYQAAGSMIMDANKLKDYLLLSGYECSTTLDKSIYIILSECTRKLGFPEAALQDSEKALQIDPNCERARMQQLLARYEIAEKEWINTNKWHFIIGFESLLSEYPERILLDPRVQEIIANVNRVLDPHKEYDHMRRRPKFGSTQNGEAAGAVAMEWLPDHVKANKKNNQKAKANTKSKKKNKTKQLVKESSSEEEEDDTCDEIYESDASSISPRGAQSDSPVSQGTTAAKSSSSYGLDDFGPIHLPHSNLNNGAIPKVLSSKPNKKEAAPEPPGNRISNASLPTGTPTAGIDYASLYCKICKVQSNAQKQLIQHLSGTKHIAKQAEYMKSLGGQSAGNQLGPGQSAPTQHASAQPQKFSMPTKNASYASQANPGPGPTMQQSAKPMMAASNAATVGPPPVISQESMHWLKKLLLRLACEKCYLTVAGKYGYQAHRYQPHSTHHCFGGWLVCRLGSVSTPSNEIWGKIRRRTKPDFLGPYTLCEQFNTGVPCKVGEESCWFCHSREEVMIWDADRAGHFNGKEIVTYLRYSQGIGVKQLKEEPSREQGGFQVVSHHTPNRAKGMQPRPEIGGSASKMAAIAVPNAAKAVLPEQAKKPALIKDQFRKSHQELMSRVRGHFLYLCGSCFDGAPQVMALKSPTRPMCSNEDSQHPWELSKALVHVLNEGRRTRYQKVRPKPRGIPARAYLCNNLQRRFGCRFGDLCKFAHNLVEIEVWEFEVLYSLMRDTIVQLCSEEVSRPPPSPSGPAPAAPATRTPAPSASQPLPTPAISQAIPKFFHDIRYVCGMCFPRNNQCVGQNPRKPAYCAGSNPHPWQHKMVVVFTASKKKYCPVKPRHPNLRREIHPKLCRHLDKCRRAECMFPHFDEEGALWKYMATYNLKTLDEVMLIVQRSSAASSNSSAASNATAASNASSPRDAATPSQVIPGQFTVQRYYCSYCDRGFAQNWQLQQHTQTIDHRAKVNSDKERQWKYRSPPWSVLNGEYRECEQHKRKACVFTNSPADKNNCTHAHSSEELEEWRERHQYRMMKMKKAKDQKLYAFMDEVLEKYNFSTNETSVITEELPGIHIQCPQDLNKFLHTERKADTTFTFTWKFLIKSKKQQSLKRVGLLYDDHRLHFYLSSPKGEDKPQVCPGNRITEGDGETYHIDVLFHSRMLGSFNQWVLFDFGSEPVLVRKLEIHVGSEQHFETFQKIQHKKQIQTWDSSNSEIVKFLDGAPVEPEQTAFEEKLLATYKPPTSLSIDDIELGRLDRDNYKLHMHKMLHLEEREQTKRIARFSIETTLNVAASIELAGQGYLVSHDGQMYASINLKQALMDDSEASQIIMRSVQKMLLKFDKTNKVYEAVILRDQDYGSQAQDNINLKLSPACVGEQNLTDGATRTVQVQFQLNRLPFCHQHYAVEKMHNMDMVFPPPNKPQRFPFIDADHLQETNFRQERAASYICKHGGSDAMPMHGVGPVLVFGPFGTGKTYTLATAVRRAVVTRPLCRILICTRSNSAADWYITEHLHKFVEQTWSKHHIRMLRIYATYRKISSIDPIVRPYVLMNESGQILLPDANKIRQYHIVITTVATSGILGLANLQGHFTHILIDEAGQTLETEVLQPLTLATGNTCVVLAGDHIQMSPKVFSDTARAAKFNKSLLERLFLLNITNVVLTYNYRTCEQILKFIAETYYHQQFKALGNHPVHPEFYPLSFCAVKGEDQHVGMSYVNNLEVLEIVFRAEELCRKWPEKWGKFNKNSIGIISPYSMQVRQIRFEMRRRGLGDIDVETVENVQGKQFRALLISTVRTRSTLKRSRLTAASQVGSSNQQDEEFYYGFLSDHKLLNTALTRAQSLVIVAGDPITLCSEGQCATTWKAFLKDCEKNKSLQGTTMEEIRQEVEAAKHRLNPFAKSFQPSASKNQTSPPRNEPGQGKQAGNWQEAGLIKMPAGQNPWKVPPQNPSAGSNLSVPGITRQSSDEFPALRSSSISNNMPGDQDGQSDENSWSADEEDIDLEDAILQELHRQVLEDRGELEVADHDSGLDSEAAVVSGSENDIQEVAQDEFMLRAKHQQETKPFMDRDSMIASHLSDGSTKRNNLTDKMNASRKLRNVRMVEGRGHILLIEDKRDRSRLEGVDTFEEYDSDEDVEEDELDENVQQENLERVSQEPDRYKICSFHFDLSGHTYALPKDEDSSLKILITSKRKRGKALNLDEIIVEILEDIDELENAVGYGAQDTVEEKKTYGKVICVLKRAVNPYLKKIVCTIDRFTDNLMVPIDRKFPKIFAYSRKDEGQKPKTKSKKNQVPEVSKVSIYNICRASDQGFQFQRNVEVSRKDRPNKLFVVQYLKWHAKTPYPVGIITEELPPGDTKENGLRILKLVHGIRERWKHSIVDEIADAFPEDWDIPKEVIKSRYDARSRVVFTIDPPESQDLDDALSIDMVEDNYFIGIHIADVSYFVKKGSALDDEAKERATSFYPSFAKPVNMLPPQLSNKLCSLLPEQDRLTISVFVTLDENGEVVGNVNIVRSVIRSRIQLSYDAAENIIKMTDETERNSNATIQEKIMTLSKLAKERRRIRLGAGRFAFSHDAEEEEAPHPLAHSLVEEMMLLANEAVARFLMMKYPKCTPLRRQLPPGEEEVKKWFDKHGKDVPNSVDLQSRPSLQELETEEESDVHVLRETWHKLKAAVEDEEQNDLTRITDIICSDENHPQLAVALSTFFRIQERSAYISSGDHPSEVAKRHHTLGMPSYTHFTSPIRRFLDLVVHRMLIASLENIQAQNEDGSFVAPYTSAELAEICHHCTNQAINCQDFDKKTHAFQLALKLKEAPEPTLAFVVSTSDAGLGLMFPYRRFIPSRSHSIPLRLLKPIQKPVMEGDASLELVWKHRIYDISGTPSPVHVQPNSEFRLDTRKFIIQISANQWQEIITGIKTEDIYQIRTAVMVATDEQEHREQDEEARRKQKRNPDVPYNLPLREVTCERSDPKKPSLFINFKRNFDLGDVVQVQLHASTQMGLLAPTVQLFGLTPKFHLCTEHRKEAITSFAEVATHRPVGMRNISSYKKVWLPIIEMLTAHNAVQSDETIIIHSVKIRWDRTFMQDTNSYDYSGFFTVREDYCDDHHIRFSHPPKINKNEKSEACDDPEAHLDYLCIRYGGLTVTSETQLRLREMDCKPRTMRPTSNVHPGKMTFVLHAATVDVTKDKGMVVVQVTGTQFSSPFPDVLLSSDPPSCTVELVPKTEPDRRLENAVRRLDSDRVSPLIRDICLLQKPRANQDDPFSKLLPALSQRIRSFEILNSPFAKPNAPQNAALRQAVAQPFTVIQGPPGTGKTITGAHLAHFFTVMNEGLPPSGKGPPQVLYCGPSNKSVDVISTYLQKLNAKVVRVYSETIERKDYPIPGEPGSTRKTGNSRDASMDPQLKGISLHHLIRQKTNTRCQNILKWEQMFRSEGYVLKTSHVKAYKHEISKAEEEELEKYQIILCTCNAAGSKRIKEYTNVVQCIIDEAGMCNEPETLIPLVSTNPCQVVLIGDHKQLRPIIQEKTAQILGMEISLLEKYEKKAHMLTMQYRMHEAICDFPSHAFYDGKLETADIVKRRQPHQQVQDIWPGGRAYPLVFCHLYGKEETLTVKTAEGNEQSKSNPQEVKHVVRMATSLVRRYQVKPEDIVILSQYRLQCAEIEDVLKRHGVKGVSVRTVITSQGSEWDYVIMSTVRSLPRIEIEEKASVGWKQKNLGFIIDENQMNVALSRAKRGLIVIGNQYLLQTHEKWKELIDTYRQHQAVVDARSFLLSR